jgi:FkbM family methyltransferase
MNVSARRGHTYLPAFLASRHERRRFRVTANPACSSLLEPNFALLDTFGTLRDEFRVEREIDVDTIALDDCLHAHGIDAVDFLELDTQGTELEILAGSQRLLAGAIVGVKVEVEFAPMYVGQALFADVDKFLRGQQFELFDLGRYRARRPSVDVGVPTRGQLLWGQALYLRQADGLTENRAARLGIVAALTGVCDFAAEVFSRLASTASRAVLREASSHAFNALQRGETIPPGEFEASRGCSIWRD